MPHDLPLQRVCRHLGSATALARALGLTKSAVQQWHRIPAHHVPAVAKLTGIDAHKLRPDLYRIRVVRSGTRPRVSP